MGACVSLIIVHKSVLVPVVALLSPGAYCHAVSSAFDELHAIFEKPLPAAHHLPLVIDPHTNCLFKGHV